MSHDHAPAACFCVDCATEQPLWTPDYCGQCGSPVVLTSVSETLPATRTMPGAWRYAGRLPLAEGSESLSLGEGNTPLLPGNTAARWCGLNRLHLKLDHLNPSGSFKDRATAVGVAHARSVGATTVVCASSGNAAASTAAYAAHAGMRAVLLVPESVPHAKLSMAKAHGATALRVRGDYSNSFEVGRALAHRTGWPNLTTTYVNPIAVSGLKSAGYELAEELGVPDWILVPVGAGPLLHGVLTAYREMWAAGAVTRLPRMVAVQPEGCHPIAAAFARGDSEVSAWDCVDTEVSGIADPLRGYPGDGTYTLRLVRESGGVAHAVSGDDVVAAARMLAHEQGLLVEPAAAASVAAGRALRCDGVIKPNDLVVALLTGHGMKTLSEVGTHEDAVVDGVDAAAAVLGIDSSVNSLVEERT